MASQHPGLPPCSWDLWWSSFQVLVTPRPAHSPAAWPAGLVPNHGSPPWPCLPVTFRVCFRMHLSVKYNTETMWRSSGICNQTHNILIQNCPRRRSELQNVKSRRCLGNSSAFIRLTARHRRPNPETQVPQPDQGRSSPSTGQGRSG